MKMVAFKIDLISQLCNCCSSNVYSLRFFLVHSSSSPPLFLLLPSGTLAPCSQTGISHPRSGITIILQILNDLLRAACHHQGAPRTLSQLHCPASNPAVSQLLTAGEQNKASSQTLVDQRTEHLGKTPGESHHSDLLIILSFDLFSAFLGFLMYIDLLNCHFKCFLVFKKKHNVCSGMSLYSHLSNICLAVSLKSCVKTRWTEPASLFVLILTKKTELFRTGHTKQCICSRVAGLTCSSSPLLQVRRADPSTHPHRRIERCTVSWSACSFWCTRGVFAGGLARAGTTRKRLTRTSIVTIVLSLLDGERFHPLW